MPSQVTPTPTLSTHTSSHLTSYSTNLSVSSTRSLSPGGIGSTAARFIDAVGKSAVHRFEGIIVQERLLAIRDHFPHDDQEPVLDEFYDDLIEVSRPELYDNVEHHQALRLLLVQIGRLHVAQLIRRLLVIWQQNWDKGHSELSRLLTKLAVCLPSEWSDKPDSGAHMKVKERLESVLAHEYTSSCPADTPHQIFPFLDFCFKLCQVEPVAIDDVVDVMNDYQTLAHTHHHPLATVCATRKECPPLSLLSYQYSSTMRRDLWGALGSESIIQRLGTIDSFLLRPEGRDIIFDACADIAESSSNDTVDESTKIATRLLLRIFSSKSQLWWDILSEVLLHSAEDTLSSLVDVVFDDARGVQSIRDTLTIMSPDKQYPCDCFINFALVAVTRHTQFKGLLLNSAFPWLFLDRVGLHLVPPLSISDVPPPNCYDIIVQIIDVVEGRQSHHRFSEENTTEEQLRVWKSAVKVFGQLPETYMPAKSRLKTQRPSSETIRPRSPHSNPAVPGGTEQSHGPKMDDEKPLAVATNLELSSTSSKHDRKYRKNSKPKRGSQSESDILVVLSGVGMI